MILIQKFDKAAGEGFICMVLYVSETFARTFF